MAAGAAAVLTEPLSSLSPEGRRAQLLSHEDVDIIVYGDVVDLIAFRMCLVRGKLQQPLPWAVQGYVVTRNACVREPVPTL